jgi:glycerate 2-kinase
MHAARIHNKVTLLRENHDVKSLHVTIDAAEAALKSVNPYLLMKNMVKITDSTMYISDVNSELTRLDLSLFESIYIVGAGKAAADMLQGLMHVLKNERKVSDAAITIPYSTVTKKLAAYITRAGHPLPDINGVLGSKKILSVLEKATSSDIVFTLISGGGSALMSLPIEGITLQEKQKITSGLLSSGATIDEINTVRKHLSSIKGGRLAKALRKGVTLVSLILSDVVSDKIEIIASGPTAPDRSTFSDAKSILLKYKLWSRDTFASQNVRKVINSGVQKKIEETPKPQDPVFKRVHNLIIGNNFIACKTLSSYLNTHGIRTMNLGSDFTGEAFKLGNFLYRLVNDFSRESVPYAFVFGGETTVKLRGRLNGTGGRNQEAVLSTISRLKSWSDKDFTILCLGTDGIDGNSEAAGALLTPKVLSEIDKRKLHVNEYLRRHDSNTLFKRVNSSVITKLTGTNVNDISIVCRLR